MSGFELDRLIRPKSIAVVGASPDPGSVSGLLLANLDRFGFAGDIHLVSRSRTEVNGRPCVPGIDDLPAGVDTAVLVLPAAAICEAVEACGRRGIGGAVVFASGFAELGEEGRLAQARLTEMAEREGVAVLGPNCMGLANFADRTPLTFEPMQFRPPAAGPKIAILAQSGAMNGNIRQALHGKGLEVSFAISTGNEVAVGVEDLLGHLVADEAVDVFAVFAEAIRKPQLFLQGARRARDLGKPVVLMHPGKSARARDAAQSHTGALAADHAVMKALVEREAVILVDSLDELFDVTEILARYPKPVHGGLAVVSNSGAIRGISIDFCEAEGVPLATLEDATLGALAALLPPFVAADNPLDLTTAGMQQPQLFGQTASSLLNDPGVGGLLMAVMGGSPRHQLEKGEAFFPAARDGDKPAVFCIMGDTAPLGDAFMALAATAPTPFLRSADRALRALAHVFRRGELHRAAQVRAPAGAAPTLSGTGPLAEYKGKAVLADLGLGIPRGGLARDADDAARLAARIGYPVALKAQADRLLHKSDVGGVAIGLADEAGLRAAWDQMTGAVRQAKPDLQLDGLLVEAMSPPGLELVVGARRDPAWGVVMMAGLGGVWIEALKDVRLFAPDLTEAQIIVDLRQLKGAKLLDGLRGKPAVDLVAVAHAVRRLADLMLANPTLLEAEINPLMAGPAGAVALDAVLVLAD